MSSNQSDLTPKLLHAVADATEEQKDIALQILEGRLSPADYVEPYVTLKDAAQKLGIHPSTLSRWKVPCYRINGRPRYLISEINAFIRAGRNQATNS